MSLCSEDAARARSGINRYQDLILSHSDGTTNLAVVLAVGALFNELLNSLDHIGVGIFTILL